MAKFRKRPVVIEAIQWTGSNWPEVIRWAYDRGQENVRAVGRDIKLGIMGTLEIETAEGTMAAQEGDWIICGVVGEVYPCRSDVFAKTYEAVVP